MLSFNLPLDIKMTPLIVNIPPIICHNPGRLPKYRNEPISTNKLLMLLTIEAFDTSIYFKDIYPSVAVKKGPRIDPIAMLPNADIGMLNESLITTKDIKENMNNKMILERARNDAFTYLICFLAIIEAILKRIPEIRTY